MNKRQLAMAAAMLVCVGLLIFGLVHRPAAPPAGPAVDWPMWRFDAARTAASPQQLAGTLHLQWVRHLPAVAPAWTDTLNRDRMGFDRVYQPIVAGSTMFVGFGASDKVVALDTRTGQERWRFYAGGPIRFAPVASAGRLYVVSDDGFLYCLDADTGAVRWSFRGGPDGRTVLGNHRLISAWPARGGCVVADGVVYFAAGIWPFMGVYVHALNAETGQIVWTNDTCGETYMAQPHSSPAFAGVAPQGALAVIGDKLLVPTGRSVPACFDRATGRLLYYRLSDYDHTGGWQVSSIGGLFFNTRGQGTDVYDLASGKGRVTGQTGSPVLTDGGYYFSGNPVVALEPASLVSTPREKQVWDPIWRRWATSTSVRWNIDTRWKAAVDGQGALIKAGTRLYAGGRGVISALDLHAGYPAVSWSARVDGAVEQLLAADQRLFAVTAEGGVYAFGAEKVSAPRTHALPTSQPIGDEAAASAAEELLARAGVRDGCCIVRGAGDGRLLEALARQSNLTIFAVEPDAKAAAALRRRLDDTGRYGERISVSVGDPLRFPFPQYVAALTIVGPDAPGPAGAATAETLFRSVRPYGGVALLPAGECANAVAAAVAKGDLPGARIEPSAGGIRLVRAGPPPGAADWTHQFADAANTVCSQDELVRAPLGLLWFGNNSNADVLPRHGHGPAPQVVGGRLFIEGIDSLSARDIYTGRLLWKQTFDDLGTFGIYYDQTHKPDALDGRYNQQHLPGANARGSNFASADDAVYLALDRACVKLDAATGKELARFEQPSTAEPGRPATWGYVAVVGDRLIATLDRIAFPRELKAVDGDSSDDDDDPGPFARYDHSASRRLVVLDRNTGRLLWSYNAALGLRHSAIAAGKGSLFCIDMLPGPMQEAVQREGGLVAGTPTLLALDLATGQRRWSTQRYVFGSWLGYSAEHDVLVQAGRRSRDMLWGEVYDWMTAQSGAKGEVLWNESFRYDGPVMLNGRTLFTQGEAYDLLTGQPRVRMHPLTGEPIRWRYSRNYGCNHAIASRNLLTFRSAAAGYYDLAADSGTSNLGGFKSGCTSNLIAAGGVLNAPDYTRTCSCSYQNQASLALVHMPDLDTWSFNALPAPVGRVRNLSLNLGAPGDRVAPDGALWLDWPSVGGPSPDPDVECDLLGAENGAKPRTALPRTVRRGSGQIVRSGPADPPAWVVASGAAGLRKLDVTFYYDKPDPRRLAVAAKQEESDDTSADQTPPVLPAVPSAQYTVRLYFAELEDKTPGQRVFDVAVQGQPVLKGLDIAREAGGPRRGLVREFKAVAIGRVLTIEMTPSPAVPDCEPLLCGVQVQLTREAPE